MELSSTATLVTLAIALAVFALAAWRSSAPPDPLKGPRLIPWTMIAILAGAVAIYMVVHLANLAGIETGRGRRF